MSTMHAYNQIRQILRELPWKLFCIIWKTSKILNSKHNQNNYLIVICKSINEICKYEIIYDGILASHFYSEHFGALYIMKCVENISAWLIAIFKKDIWNISLSHRLRNVCKMNSNH